MYFVVDCQLLSTTFFFLLIFYRFFSSIVSFIFFVSFFFFHLFYLFYVFHLLPFSHLPLIFYHTNYCFTICSSDSLCSSFSCLVRTRYFPLLLVYLFFLFFSWNEKTLLRKNTWFPLGLLVWATLLTAMVFRLKRSSCFQYI